jgi:hypothetical protein
LCVVDNLVDIVDFHGILGAGEVDPYSLDIVGYLPLRSLHKLQSPCQCRLLHPRVQITQEEGRMKHSFCIYVPLLPSINNKI